MAEILIHYYIPDNVKRRKIRSDILIHYRHFDPLQENAIRRKIRTDILLHTCISDTVNRRNISPYSESDVGKR